MCRRKVDPSDASQIYNKILIQPLVQSIFQKSDEEQVRIFNSISNIVQLSTKSEWLSKNIDYICERFSKTSLDARSLYCVMNVFDTMLKTLEQMGGVNNVDPNQLVAVIQQII
jgi:hypothetical protein